MVSTRSRDPSNSAKLRSRSSFNSTNSGPSTTAPSGAPPSASSISVGNATVGDAELASEPNASTSSIGGGEEDAVYNPLLAGPGLSTNTSTSSGSSSAATGGGNSGWRVFWSRHTVISMALAVGGWFWPRHYIEHNTSMLKKRPPFQETAAGDVILDFLLMEPLVHPTTIPTELLIGSSIGVPLLLTVGLILCCRSIRQSTMAQLNSISNIRTIVFHHVHAAVCGLATAVGFSEGATLFLKVYVQRRRPNFYALCGFDVALRLCTADIEHIKEANFSFPSGHSSLVCCGMMYLAWFLVGKLILVTLSNNNSNNSNNSPLFSISTARWLAFLSFAVPLSWAAFVGASRLFDHWHHPSDVITGLVLGGSASTLGYHIWFPPAWQQWQPQQQQQQQSPPLEQAKNSGGSGSASFGARTVAGIPWSLIEESNNGINASLSGSTTADARLAAMESGSKRTSFQD